MNAESRFVVVAEAKTFKEIVLTRSIKIMKHRSIATIKGNVNEHGVLISMVSNDCDSIV